MPERPTGTVTFLFTDIEGSTQLAQSHPDEWERARQRHHDILNEAIGAHHGFVFQTSGDAFCAAFHTAPQALAAALAGQRALQAEPWGQTPIKVRMGLHTGAAEFRDGEYQGYLSLAHAQRVMSTAHGGQTLVSNATAGLLSGHSPSEVSLRDMGEHRLKGILNPERLWQPAAPDLPQDFPPLQTLNAIPNNLPIQVTSFVGRERETNELQRLLSKTRLLTLTGSGGTGKTRLSLQVASEVLDHYADGVWFIELAPLTDPALVPFTVASALGIREEQARPMLATLLDWLRARQLLLILDNCEHLIDACARLADAVLHAGHETQILASSREALGIAGETAYRVPSLECPSTEQASRQTAEQLTQYAAVQLFIERAAQSETTFSVTNANAPAVAQICYRLDGIPLAIELAAARVKALSVEKIAERLDDRFRLLTGGSRTALPRQQTLRGAIDWSHSLLTEPERILLRRLSVFAGGWWFEAAESVCSGEGIEAFEVLDLLARLVEKSLVVKDDAGGPARYHLLETIRQYAREKLLDSGEIAQHRARHLDNFSQTVVSYDFDQGGRGWSAWLARIISDVDNLRAALDWSLESGDITPGLRVVGELDLFWWQRYPSEGLYRLQTFLSHPEAQARTAVRAQALFAAGHLQAYFGNAQPGRRSPGDPRAARRWLAEALAISREVGADLLIAATLYMLAHVASELREYETARTYHSEGLAAARKVGTLWVTGSALHGIGYTALRQGMLEQAQAAFEESLSVVKPLPADMSVRPVSLRGLGQIALRRGELARAHELFGESLVLNQDANDRRGIAASLAALAGVRAAQGDTLAAVKVCGAVDMILETLRADMIFYDQEPYDHTVAALRTALPAPAFEAAWAEGRALTMEQAIALALERTTEGK